MEQHFRDRNIHQVSVRLYFSKQYLQHQRQLLQKHENDNKQTELDFDVQIQEQLNKNDLSKQDFYTKLYQFGLEKIYGESFDNIEQKQIALEINKLNPIQQKQFWDFVKVYDQNSAGYSQNGQQYFKRSYCRTIFTDKINDIDKEYIQQYLANNKELPLKKQVEWLVENYFVFRDVFPEQIYRYIQTYNKKLSKK
ncbi:Hypothetical_protein [Hexamita inflata]|uniref:Hypothetical_protein n=1 Tax=Hexamita inflata TaxID=28002 RepID=A0AA86REK8_9EUKA|nr:Hypothetical protein HINF_LOCUS63845 [Hexamita inflata]